VIEIGAFFSALTGSPVLVVVLVLTLGATVVNGATDAPNAIATVVGTRSMSPGKAIIMAAICNFLGLVIITSVSAAVAKTIFGMVNFGGDSHAALLALAAAMIAIIVWGVAAWRLGIPTSQSHSLIAGLTGAAIALQSGIGGVNGAEWIKVIYGLLISTVLGFGSGWLFTKTIERLARNADRRKMSGFWLWAQRIAGAGVALMHGAQDGQKFLSISLMGIMLCMGLGDDPTNMSFPFWLIVLVALAMGLGTAVGGKKIIKNVGLDMVKMEPYQGFSVCLSSVFCIALATFTGMPVSTTHTTTTAIMGVGASKRLSNVKWNKAGHMVLTWVLTFPGCGIIGYVLAKVFLLF
jgi:inorganic phosphate transporter, PiT family